MRGLFAQISILFLHCMKNSLILLQTSDNNDDKVSELKEMSSNHSEGKHDEEALEPENDVVEQIHLVLEKNVKI